MISLTTLLEWNSHSILVNDKAIMESANIPMTKDFADTL